MRFGRYVLFLFEGAKKKQVLALVPWAAVCCKPPGSSVSSD